MAVRAFAENLLASLKGITLEMITHNMNHVIDEHFTKPNHMRKLGYVVGTSNLRECDHRT